MKRSRRAALAAIAAVTMLVGVVPGAVAHPSGVSQKLTVTPADGGVRVTWKLLSQHELTLLAVHLGLLPTDRVLLDGAVEYRPGDEQVLAAAPELGAYALDHVTAATGEGECRGAVEPVGDLLDDGLTIAFACDGAARTATVRADLLTDVDPAYQALGVGPDGQRAVYGRDDASHDWVLRAGPAPVRWLTAGVATLLGVGVAGWLVRRRTRLTAEVPVPAPA